MKRIIKLLVIAIIKPYEDCMLNDMNCEHKLGEIIAVKGRTAAGGCLDRTLDVPIVPLTQLSRLILTHSSRIQ